MPETKTISYEILDEPLKMHVVVPEGVKKFSFANVQSWEDLNTVGPTYPINANVEVAAIAHVPIGEDTAKYYLDAMALGTEFDTTGRVAYTVGFNHSQLADGYVEPESKAVPPEREQRIRVLMQGDKDQPAPGIAALPTTELDYREAEEVNKWVSTYVAYPKPILFVAKEELWVKDFMGKRSDKQLKANQDVISAGHFIVDDEPYERPLGAAKNFLWYGVPRSNLDPEEEVYNTDIPLHERVAAPQGRLSTSERYITVPLARAISQTTRLRTYLDKIKNKKGAK